MARERPLRPTKFPSRGESLDAGSPCPNCGAMLTGRYCASCGQKAEDYHRLLWRLGAEALEGLTDFDGRFRRTLPRLIFRPGQLTHANQGATHTHFRLATPTASMVKAAALVTTGKAPTVTPDLLTPRASDSVVRRWMRAHAAKAMTEPDAVFGAMERWSERFAVLMLPIATLLMAALFAFRPGVYVFDHVIFVMHSLTFLALLLSTILILGSFNAAAAVLLLAAPVHLFVHMRGVYRISIAGALTRMALLFVGSVAAFCLLILGLVLIGLSAAH